MRDRAAELLLMALCCAPGEPGPLPDLRESEWERAFALASQVGMLPRLHHFLEQTGATAPPRVCSRLRAFYQANRARSQRLRAVAIAVCERLARHGIPCCLLKGAALAEATTPGDWSRRFSADLDLLVPEADGPTAWKLVREMGAVPVRSTQRHHHHHLPALFLDGYPVELHQALCRPSLGVTLDTKAAQQRRVQAHPDSPLWVLSPTDQLLHLCLHLAGSHGFAHGLRGAFDVGTLLGTLGERVNWDEVLAVAAGSGAAPYLYHSLRPAVELLHAPLPPGLLSRLARLQSSGRLHTWGTAAVVRWQLLPWRWPRRHVPDHFAAYLCSSLVVPLPSWARLRRLLTLVFVPMDWSAPEPRPLPAPAALPYPLWLAIRPGLLTLRYLGRLCGLAPGPRTARMGAKRAHSRHLAAHPAAPSPSDPSSAMRP